MTLDVRLRRTTCDYAALRSSITSIGWWGGSNRRRWRRIIRSMRSLRRGISNVNSYGNCGGAKMTMLEWGGLNTANKKNASKQRRHCSWANNASPYAYT